MAKYNEKLGDNTPINLFASVIPEAKVVSIKLAAAGIVKAGTIVTGTPGGADFAALAAAASASKALFIVTDDVDTSVDTVCTAYASGCFNRNALTVGSAYTLTAADIEVLRKCGIIVESCV